MQTEALLDIWRLVRQESVQAIREFPAGRLDEEIIPGFMTFRKLHRHILESCHIFTGLLLDGAEAFNTPEIRSRFGNYLPVVSDDAGAGELAEALETSLKERCASLEQQPPEFWSREVVHFSGVRMNAHDMMLMLVKHESEHRAQAALLSRVMGIVPATTRRRLAAQAG
jgi:uncharacterized damage-inducible protein DinB